MNIEKLFEKGLFKELLEQVEAKSSTHLSEREQVLAVCSHYFWGEPLKADSYLAGANFSTANRAQILYFTLIYQTRVSAYADSRATLIELIRLRRRHRADDTLAFFSAQALGFFHYYRSHLGRSIFWSQKAYRLAYASRDNFRKIHATDLLGHGLFQIGQYEKGLRYLDEALELARRIPHDGIIYSLEISLTNYRTQIASDIEANIKALEEALKKILKPGDIYSASNLYLQLAQQKILFGQFAEAEEILRKISMLIFRSSNRRQAAMLNFRYAFLHHLRGDDGVALQFLKNSEDLLDRGVDHAMLAKIFGLQERILKRIDVAEGARSAELCLKKSAEARVALSAAINARAWQANAVTTLEDPLGHRISEVAKADSTEKKVDAIVRYKLFFLAPQLFAVDVQSPARENQIIAHRAHLFCISSHGVHFVEAGFSGVMRKLLQSLKRGMVSKTELLAEIWGIRPERYNPEVDDPLVFSNLTRLRKLLGPSGHLLVSNETGYSLDARVLIKDDRRHKADSNAEPEVTHARPRRDLNWRQSEGLYLIKERRYLSVRDYRKIFKVSEATARRDLLDLKKKGLVESQGRGRATTYCKF